MNKNVAGKKGATTAGGTKDAFGRSAVAAVLALGCLAGAPMGTHAQDSAEGPWAKGRILVMPRAGLPPGAMATIVGAHGGKARRIGASNLHIVDLPPNVSERAVVARLSHDPRLKFAELDHRIQPDLVTNDPYLGSQWHLPKIGAPAAWDVAQGLGITIAILDTGVDATHPDLSSRIVPGWNFYDNNPNTADVYGHGTKVAGAAAATSNNAAGVASVAAQARIMPIRISAPDGTGYWSTIAQGLTYAADQGARVANVSYMCSSSASVQSAAQYMKNKGGLVFVSAGNTGAADPTPATTALIPVAATDSNDLRTSFSTYGSFVAMSAPGSGIYTTTSGGGYAAVSGTSFSAPVAAGVAALVMSARPALSSADVENLIFSTAEDLGAAGRDPYYGHGRVEAWAAVQAASGTTAADTQAPAAAISAPLASASVSGAVPVDVSVTDNVGVTKVELRVNGATVAVDTTSPFAFSWDSTKVANGTATLIAYAYDAAGNVGASASVAVGVSNTTTSTPGDATAPAVSFVSPTGTKIKGGFVKVEVRASDNAGASGITQSLYIDGALQAAVNGSSLVYNWDARKIASGRHELRAVARDAAGNSSSSTLSLVK